MLPALLSSRPHAVALQVSRLLQQGAEHRSSRTSSDVVLKGGSGMHAELAEYLLLLARICGAAAQQRGISPDLQGAERLTQH
jgi:hypothetical protein